MIRSSKGLRTFCDLEITKIYLKTYTILIAIEEYVYLTYSILYRMVI